MKYPEIAQRVFHTPLLAAPAKAAAFAKGLGPRLLSADSVEVVGISENGEIRPSAKPYASLLDDRLGAEIRAGGRDAYRMLEGAAIIPITGSLIHRGAWVGSFSGETSYEGIGAQLDAAVEDRSVRGIALEIDSYGGEVAGCFDLADRIRAAREHKPVHAFVCDHAFSAAYALASQADHVVIPRAGGVGSIGVICLHMDYSQQLETVGVRVSVIAAGDHKGDANPYEPLPDEVRENLQAEMEALRVLFAETVGEGRGDRFTTSDALASEAGCFLGQNAIELGLADEVANPREAFERFIAQINGQGSSSPFIASQKGNQSMGTKPNNSPGADVETPKIEDEAPPQEPISEGDEGQDVEASEQEIDPDASAPGTAPAADDDPAKRIEAILYCSEAEGREDMARHLAFKSSMSAADAQVLLASAPKGQTTGGLSQSMDAHAEEAELDLPPSGQGEENPVLAAVRQANGK